MISQLEFKNAVATVTPTNHVFVVDVSYSMYNVLPKIRQHLKNNLASLVKAKDTVSILYFSSRNQCGTVFVGQPVNTLEDLTDVHTAIDRYLKPIGCTGFVDPLKLSMDVANQLSEQNNNLNSLIFMTDGYDNEWSNDQILKECMMLPRSFTDISFLEYGWHCNRKLLEQMSEATGALHKFTENYEAYEPAFEEIISANTAKRVEVEVGDATHLVYIDDGIIRIVNAHNGIALVPENVSTAWSVGDNALEAVDTIDDEQILYVTLYYAVHTMNPDLVWKILKKLGDVRLIKAYDNCFTKQDYSNAKDLIAGAVLSTANRFVDGIDYNMVPDENAITVADVLDVLVSANAVVDTNSEFFSYNRTGRASVQKEDDTIAQLSDQIASASTAEERKELAMKLVEHEEWTPKFTPCPLSLVSMNKLVSNGSRPNISINTDIKGSVAIPESIQIKYGLPHKVDTKIYRNYTVVKDGIINMKQLPVIIHESQLETLVNTGVKGDVYNMDPIKGDVSIIVHLDSVPLVNRAMTKGLSGKDFLTKHVQLQELKAMQKVFKFYREELVGKVNATGLADKYGADAAKFLSENGIRDYGFSPKSTRAESTDFYMSKELNVKIKTLSSLPSVNAVIKKIETGKKLNAADHLMKLALDSYEQLKSMCDTDEQLAENLKTQTANKIGKVRFLESELSKTMYGIVVAHSWFADMELEDTKMAIPYNGYTFDCEIVLEEKKIKI